MENSIFQTLCYPIMGIVVCKKFRKLSETYYCVLSIHNSFLLGIKDVKSGGKNDMREKSEINIPDDDRGSASGEPETVRTTGKLCSCSIFPNDVTQNYPFCRLQLAVKTFGIGHSS